MKLTLRSTSLILGVGALGFAGISAAQAQTLADRYSFNDTGSVVLDSVGGQNGTLANGATEAGGALVTNGSGGGATTQFADLGKSFSLPTGQITIEDFFTPDANQAAYSTTFSFATSQTQYIIGTSNRSGDGKPGVEDRNGPNPTSRVQTSPFIAGQLNQFVIVYDGTNATSYLNGVLGAVAPDTTFPGSLITPTGPFNGIAGNGPFGDSGLNGTTSDFRIYSGALTATQVAAEYAAGPDKLGIPAAVPEASTTVSFGLLLALGLGGIAVARKRQANHQA